MIGGDALRAFADALAAYGLAAERIVADGRIHRVRGKGEKAGKRSGWYLLHLDGAPAGAFGDWRSGEAQRWRHESDQPLSDAERRRIDAAIAQAKEQRERERAACRKAAQATARRQWEQAGAVDRAHPYLQRKGVGAYGIRQLGEQLLIPMRDAGGALWAVQRIAPDGSKRFGRGARKRGLYHPIGSAPDAVLCLAEGYATAASIHEATGYPVAVAFDCNNLLPVARALRAKYPRTRLVVCADDDADTATRLGRNPGIEAAIAAARAVDGVLASPSTLPALPGQGMSDARSLRSGT